MKQTFQYFINLKHNSCLFGVNESDKIKIAWFACHEISSNLGYNFFKSKKVFTCRRALLNKSICDPDIAYNRVRLSVQTGIMFIIIPSIFCQDFLRDLQ